MCKLEFLRGWGWFHKDSMLNGSVEKGPVLVSLLCYAKMTLGLGFFFIVFYNSVSEKNRDAHFTCDWEKIHKVKVLCWSEVSAEALYTMCFGLIGHSHSCFHLFQVIILSELCFSDCLIHISVSQMLILLHLFGKRQCTA